MSYIARTGPGGTRTRVLSQADRLEAAAVRRESDELDRITRQAMQLHIDGDSDAARELMVSIQARTDANLADIDRLQKLGHL